MTTALGNTTDTRQKDCACGCGERTARTVRMLRAQDVGTAQALHWAALSIAPMREGVHVIEGHEDDCADYVADASSAR